MTKIYKIVLRHYLVGILITAIVFWGLNEFPSYYYFKEHQLEWIATIVSIPIIGIWTTIILFKNIRQTETRLYILSSLMILITWILVLYARAMTVGFSIAFDNQPPGFIDAILGFTYYQLWIYFGLGLTHGLIGGIFLKIDLRRNSG